MLLLALKIPVIHEDEANDCMTDCEMKMYVFQVFRH